MIEAFRQHGIWVHPAGTVVRVSHDWYDHVALLSEREIGGERSVLAFSAQAGGFTEQPFTEFANGRAVTIEGYLGRLPPATVIARARSTRRWRYSWTGFNCEHFVRHAHGVEIKSPQLRQWAIFGGLASVIALAARA
jgi:Lecithin retinol acyltransferase